MSAASQEKKLLVEFRPCGHTLHLWESHIRRLGLGDMLAKHTDHSRPLIFPDAKCVECQKNQDREEMDQIRLIYDND